MLHYRAPRAISRRAKESPLVGSSRSQSRAGNQACVCLKESFSMYPIRKPTMPVLQPEPIIPVGERKTMETLMAQDCRWPIGDPQGQDFHFCGKQKVDGHPYCEFHVRRANQPTRPRTVSYPHFGS
ncbi:MAG: GcrA family cell cycle regulator [Hyphomicrobium sp.]